MQSMSCRRCTCSKRCSRRKSRQRAREERERVRREQARLEREERARQEAREAEWRRQREDEKRRILELRRRQEEERERLRKEMLAKSAEEMNQKANQLKAQNESRRANNPFLQYKKMNTLETVKEISKKVNEVAVVGQIVTERVNEISNELEASCGDDYEIIKSEMDRYKNYGKEMSSMTHVFVEEFQKVFPNISNTNVEEIIEIQNIANESKNEEEKKDLKTEVEEQLNGLNSAIKNVEAKLFLMEQYYDQMTIDYTYFKTFCNKKQDELGSVSQTFKDLAAKLKEVDRSVLEGTGDEQKTEFTEEYEYQQTCTEETGFKMKNAVITGAVTGGVVGGVVGFCGGGPGGAVVGAVGGAVLGAGIGALCALANPYESKVTSTTVKGKVTYKDDLITYCGQEHATAVQKIVTKITGCNAYTKLRSELESSEQDADEKLFQCKRMKGDIQKIGEKVRNYKSEMKALTDKFATGENVSDTQAKLIDRGLKKLCKEVKAMITTMQ